jgi:hypothetical protein
MTADQLEDLRGFIRAWLLRTRGLDEVRRERIRELEAAGTRIMDSSGVWVEDDQCARWMVTDWRTGAVLASGTEDTSEDPAFRALGKVCHIDLVDDELHDRWDHESLPASSLPASLTEKLADWAIAASEDDLSAVTGWSTGLIRHMRAPGGITGEEFMALGSIPPQLQAELEADQEFVTLLAESVTGGRTDPIAPIGAIAHDPEAGQ